MVSLARSSLVYEWRRYAAAAFAITFAGLLVIVQLALLLGLFGTVTVVVDQSDADIWIGYPRTQSVDLGRKLAHGAELSAWMNPSVRRVERLAFAQGDLRRRDGVSMVVFMFAIDSRPSGLAFARQLTPRQRRLLDEPHAVIIDIADQPKLGVEIGSLVEINGKRARIVDIVDGIRGVGTVSVVTSLANLRTFAPEMADETTYHLVGLKPGVHAGRVVPALVDASPIHRYEAWTAEDLSARSQLYWLLETGVGIGTGFASLLALLVGMAITSQTLSGAILASLKEFAALRALGVSRASLRNVVLEQSFWLGMIGLALTGLLTGTAALLGRVYHVPMSFPWWLIVGVSAIILAIALGSGLIALRPLYQAEPANLLR